VSSAGDTFTNRPVTLADYLAILRRRKWIIVALPALAAIVAYAASARQDSVYRAQAQVWIDLNNAATAITGTPNQGGFDPTRYLNTQARVARSPDLAERVASKTTVPGTSAGGFLSQSKAEPEADVDVLDLSVSSADRGNSVSLANTYARQFTRFKAELDQAAITATLQRIGLQIKRLQRNGATDTPRYDTLVQQQLELQNQGELLAKNSKVLEPAVSATKIQPRPRRNAILGALLGLVVALGLAFLAEALDRRVRSEEEIERTLGLPLLGRLPAPSRRLRRANKLVMLAEPQSVHAETFRKLRTSLEFVNFERDARTIMVTSAGAREGKTTTAANLGVALARAGRRVVLVDLDLRRPFLHSFFHSRGDHGITDVVVDRVDLEDAIRMIALPGAPALGAARSSNGRRGAARNESASNGRPDTESVVHLLPSGTIPPAADEFLESERIGDVIDDLSKQFDIVLVDAPPLLAVGDVMTLSAKVDAMVVVTHLGIHRRQLQEFARQLQSCRAALLGFVLTGVSHGDSYSYGYGYDPHVYDVRERTERREPRV
jgi:polysaccharide biosynthesis transport protein